MARTLYTVGPIPFAAYGYSITQTGTVVPDGVVANILAAALAASVTISTAPGGGLELVQVPSYYNDGTGAPAAGDSLPIGAEVKDSQGAVFVKKADGTWVAYTLDGGTP